MIMTEENPVWVKLPMSLVLKLATHPFEYAKVLIQIGHEPLPPYPSRTLFKKPVLALPNVIEYVKYIKQVDGFSGCYRALFPRLVCNSVNIVTYKTVYDASDRYAWELFPHPKAPEDELSNREKFMKLCNETFKEINGRTVSIVVTQPLHVITLRIAAQFVGRELKYNGILSSIVEIYRNEGIWGFFSGLVPRLLGEILLILFMNGCLFLGKHYIKDEEVVKYGSIPVAFVGAALTYPFSVISTCMAVNNCGIAAGRPPLMPIYSSWVECWRHLYRTDQLNRGSSVFFRYYKGPHVSSTGYHDFVLKKTY